MMDKTEYLMSIKEGKTAVRPFKQLKAGGGILE